MDIEKELINRFFREHPGYDLQGDRPKQGFTADVGEHPLLRSLACIYMVNEKQKTLEQKKQGKQQALRTLEENKEKLEALQRRLENYRVELNELKQLPAQHKISQKIDYRQTKIDELESELEEIDITGQEQSVEKAGEDIVSSKKELAGICRYASPKCSCSCVKEFFEQACPDVDTESKEGEFGFPAEIIRRVFETITRAEEERDRAEKEALRRKKEQEELKKAHREYVRKKKREQLKGGLRKFGRTVIKWGLRAAVLSVAAGGGLYLYFTYRPDSEKEAVLPAVPAPRTAPPARRDDQISVTQEAPFSIQNTPKEQVIIHSVKMTGNPLSVEYFPDNGHVLVSTDAGNTVKYELSFTPKGKEEADIALWALRQTGKDNVTYYSIDPVTGKADELAANSLTRYFKPRDVTYPVKNRQELLQPDKKAGVSSEGTIHLVDVTEGKDKREIVVEPFTAPQEEFDNRPDAVYKGLYFDISLIKKDFRILKEVDSREVTEHVRKKIIIEKKNSDR